MEVVVGVNVTIVVGTVVVANIAQVFSN